MKENENFNEMTKMTDYCGIRHAELVSASFQQTDTDKTLKQVQGDRKNAFTLSCKSFRSRLLRALHTQSHRKAFANQVSQVSLAHSYGFTLAETLITLSILGIVAAITIPALVGRQIENQNRTKLKKAMTMYEKAINNMLIENDLQTETAFQNWAKTDATTNNYQEQLGYFKIAEMSTKEGATNCRFKTADRIWWDICGTNDSNIENAIVILDEKYKDTDRSELETLAKTEKVDGKKVYVFGLVGHRDETTGSVRVDDKAYEDLKKNGNYPTYMEKLYAFIEKREMSNSIVTPVNSSRRCDDTTKNDGGNYFSCLIFRSDNDQITTETEVSEDRINNCVENTDLGIDGCRDMLETFTFNSVDKYDGEGNVIHGGNGCRPDGSACRTVQDGNIVYNPGGDGDCYVNFETKKCIDGSSPEIKCIVEGMLEECSD